jgi:hypothetical protein
VNCKNSNFIVELNQLDFIGFLALSRALGVPIYNPLKKKMRDDFDNMRTEILRAYRRLSPSKQRKIVRELYLDRTSVSKI